MNRKNKKTIGFALFPEKGAYYPTFKLAKALQAKNYDVIYFGTIEFRNDVLAQGLKFQLVFEQEFSAGSFDDEPLPSGTGFLKRYKYYSKKEKQKMIVLLESLNSGQLINAIKHHSVDLMLVDAMLAPVATAIHVENIKVITLATELIGNEVDAPPFTSSYFQTTSSPDYAKIIQREWKKFKLKGRFFGSYYLLLDLVFGLFPLNLQILNLFKNFNEIHKKSSAKFVYSEYGIRPVFDEFVLCPHGFAKPLENVAPNRRYIGHCIDFERNHCGANISLPVVATPIVYCSLGTHVALYAQSHKFFKEFLKYAQSEPGITFIVSTGPRRNLAEYGVVPPNVFAYEHVPQLSVLEKASAMITNGGLGTIKECILLSVPMLVLPCRFDQPGNAARVVAHGIGRRDKIETLSVAAMKQHIHELIYNSKYKESILNMSEGFKVDQSFLEGVLFIDDVLSELCHSNFD